MRISLGLFRAWFVASALLIAGAVRSQSLDEQALCAEQAKKAFKEYSDGDKFASEAMGMMRVMIDYKNHYNSKIEKCLIYIVVSELRHARGNYRSAYLMLMKNGNMRHGYLVCACCHRGIRARETVRAGKSLTPWLRNILPNERLSYNVSHSTISRL